MGSLLIALLQLASLVFVARAILSWFPINPSSSFYPVVNGLYRLTEPVLAPIRRLLPAMGGIDLSIIIVIIGINFVLVPIASQL